MVHDDEIGGHAHFEIGSEHRQHHIEISSIGAPSTPEVKLPSVEMQQHIIELAQQPGWQTERIHAHLRLEYNRHDISKDAISYIITTHVQRPDWRP